MGFEKVWIKFVEKYFEDKSEGNGSVGEWSFSNINKFFIVLNGKILVFATQNKVYWYRLIDSKILKFWDHECDFNFMHFPSHKDRL